MDQSVCYYVMKSKRNQKLFGDGSSLKYDESLLLCGVGRFRIIFKSNSTVQLDKTDGILGFQFGNQRLTTAVHRELELRSRMQISLIDCNLASYH